MSCAADLIAAGFSKDAAARLEDFVLTATRVGDFDAVFGAVGEAHKAVKQVELNAADTEAVARIDLLASMSAAVKAGRKAGQGLIDYLEGSFREKGGLSVAHQVEGRMAQVDGAFRAMLQEMGPNAVSRFSQGHMDRDILNAFTGVSSDPKVTELVEMAKAIDNQLRVEQGLKGRHVLTGGTAVPWTFSRRKVIEAFGPANAKGHVTGTDYDLTRDAFTGALKAALKADAFDEKQVHALFDDVMLGKKESAFHYFSSKETDESAFLTRLVTNDGQKGLHFRDGDAAWAFHEQVSATSIAESLVNGLKQQARDTAIVGRLTKDPARFVEESLEAVSSQLLKTNSKAALALERDRGKILDATDRLTGKGQVPVDSRWTIAKRTLSEIGAVTRLGNLAIMGLPDRANIAQTSIRNGVSALRAWSNALRPYRNERERIMLMAQGAEVRALVASLQDEYSSGEPNPAKRVGRFANKFFTLVGANWMDDVGTHAAVRAVPNQLGIVSHLAYDALPVAVQASLARFDINPLEWDVVRSTAFSVSSEGAIAGLDPTDGMNRWVTADQMTTTAGSTVTRAAMSRGNTGPDAIVRTQTDLAAKLRSMTIAARDDAMYRVGAKERRLLALGTKPGTPSNTLLGAIMMFKGFGLAAVTRGLRREMQMSGASGPSDFMFSGKALNWHTIHMLATTLLLGELSVVLTSLTRGETPYVLPDDDDKIDGSELMAHISRVMTAGGFGGLYTDFLFSEYDKSNKSFLRKAGGPVLSELDTLVGAGSKGFRNLLTGETQALSVDAMKALRRNAPNLWYTKWAVDHLIWNRLIDLVDDEALANMRSFQTERGVRYWADPTLLQP